MVNPRKMFWQAQQQQSIIAVYDITVILQSSSIQKEHAATNEEEFTSSRRSNITKNDEYAFLWRFFISNNKFINVIMG